MNEKQILQSGKRMEYDTTQTYTRQKIDIFLLKNKLNIFHSMLLTELSFPPFST